MSIANTIQFRMVSFVHETLYGLFRDPFKALKAAGVEPGQKVLEVGCGPGFFTVPAAKMVGEQGSVTALDINPRAVEHVREKIEQAGVTNATAICANAARTGLPHQSFDLVFLFGFRHTTGNMTQIMAEMHRLLKPAGKLATEGRMPVSESLFMPLDRQGRMLQFEKRE